MRQSHNGQKVPLSIVDISSLLIVYAFKQFEIIVTFNPTKSNYEHPIYLLKKGYWEVHQVLSLNTSRDSELGYKLLDAMQRI